jgi:hypothetical protein
MTREDVRAEIEQRPFIPFRVHMVSGKTLDVKSVANVALLQNAMLVLGAPVDAANEGDYNIVSLRNIERLERLESAPD